MKGLFRRVATFVLYSCLPRLLDAWPGVTYRPPALVLGTVRWLAQPGPRRAAGPALRALGRPATRLARWRFAWQVAYHAEVSHLLHLQSEKLSDDWVARHVRGGTLPPPGGAILLSPHQEYGRLGNLYLRMHGYRVGLVADDNRVTWDRDHPDHAARAAAHGNRGEFYLRRWRFWERALDGNVFRPPEDTRAALRFLREGGYLVIKPDGYRHAMRERWERGEVLGRAIPVAPGPVWLAQHSGKPILPYLTVPTGRGWRMVVGEPVEPTQRGVAACLTACLRESPETMHGLRWLAWSQAPVWGMSTATTELPVEREAVADAR